MIPRMSVLSAMVPVILLALAAPSTFAHHGWGNYDTSKVLTITAPVLELRYRNPHGELVVESSGKKWLVTLAPTSRMQSRGLPADDIAVGEIVTVEGYPSKVHEAELRAERIIVAGRTVELR